MTDLSGAAAAAGAPARAVVGDDLAVLARTSVDCARVASLTSYPRGPGAPHLTTAAVRARADGTVEALLSPASPAVRLLLARPIATLRLAPVGCEPVLLHGAARRLSGASDDGRLVFHVEAGAVRVGPRADPVDEAGYATAAPDPLRHDAPKVLTHLNSEHSDAMAACLRARGCDAQFVEAVRLDAEGLTVLAVAASGVATVRLRFGTRISQLEQLPTGLHALLVPRAAGPPPPTAAPRRPGVQGDRQERS